MWYLAVTMVMITALLAMSLGVRLTEELERANRLVEAELESSAIYSEALRQRAAEARRYRHDAAGLMQAIERQLALDAEGAGEVASSTRQRTGMPLLDAIIDLKEQRCHELGIPLEVKVVRLDGCSVPEGDVAELVQNLLDNAIEASEHVDDGAAISLEADCAGGVATIRVRNRTASSELPTFRSRKTGSEPHGLGTGIVDDIVKAHAGSKHVDFDPATRTLEITLSFPTR